MKESRKIEAVVFDMDGLIFDSERVVKNSWDAAGDRLGYGKLGDNIYHTLGFSIVKRKIYFTEKYGADFPFETFAEHSREAFYTEVKEEGLPVKRGVKELLEYLHQHNYLAAVATSSRTAYAKRSLEQAGIIDQFNVTVFGEMAKESKPAPDIYLLACDLLQKEPSNCLALEDSPNGIRSASAAGLCPVMIPDLVEPEEELLPLLFAKKRSLLEVIPFLKEIS